MKKKKSILLISFILFLIGCSSYKNIIEKNLMNGIWVFDNQIDIQYIDDTTSFYRIKKPLIIDFEKNNNLIIKRYGIKDTTVNAKWFLKSDSILKIDSLDYKIYQYEKNKLSILDFNKADTILLNFKKPRKRKLTYSKKQIENILTSRIWKTKDITESQKYNSFEFFKNKSLIYRYKMNKRDSIEYLSNELWGLAEYKNYFFLYNYADYILGNGNWEQINQILKIKPDFFSLEKDYDNKIYDNNFYSEIQTKKSINIFGNWKSKNSKIKNYGEFISKLDLEKGDSKLFEGELNLKINDQFIEFKLDSLMVGKYKWELGKDYKTLLMKKKYKGELRDGEFIYLADIIEQNEEILILHLIENQFLTGFEKPRSIIVNKIQAFKKQKN